MWGAPSLLGLAGGLAAVAAGAGLAWSGARRPGSRHFAAFAALWGAHVVALAAAAELAPRAASLLAGAGLALLLASVLFLGGFVAAFPTRASPRWADVAVAGAAALAAWFLLDYDAFRSPAGSDAGGAALSDAAIVGLVAPLAVLLAAGAMRAVSAWRRSAASLAKESHLAAVGLFAALASAGATALGRPGWVAPAALTGALGTAIVAFAIVKHHVIDLEEKLHRTAARGAVLAIFGGVFFAVDQLAQIFVSDRFGALAGFVAALLLVFALAPIRRFSERLAERLFPTEPAETLDARKATVYRAAAHAAMKDGNVSESEREMLDALVRELGLPAAEAAQIEREVLGQAAA